MMTEEPQESIVIKVEQVDEDEHVVESSPQEQIYTPSSLPARPEFLAEHDYCIRQVPPEDLPMIKELERQELLANPLTKIDTDSPLSTLSSLALAVSSSALHPKSGNDENLFTKKFSKCEKCRRSRTKVLVPDSLLSVTHGKNDGVTCDFCGDVMAEVQPVTLPDVFEGRRGSKGGDRRGPDGTEFKPSKTSLKKKNYVYCGECGKVVLKESLTKHMRDVHELTNKRACPICNKLLSGPFSLKEHISAVHKKQTKHQCPKCNKMFAHFSNMNRHIRLIHNKMVVTHKYVNCTICKKVVQSTSLKKHMAAIHDQRRDFKCQYCDKSFAQSYTLKEHTAAKHTFEYGHKCRLCGKAFAHKTNCGRHLKTVHKNEVLGKYSSEHELIRNCIVSVNDDDDDDALLVDENEETAEEEDVEVVE